MKSLPDYLETKDTTSIWLLICFKITSGLIMREFIYQLFIIKFEWYQVDISIILRTKID